MVTFLKGDVWNVQYVADKCNQGLTLKMKHKVI